MKGQECHQWERNMTHIYQKVAILLLQTFQIRKVPDSGQKLGVTISKLILHLIHRHPLQNRM